VKIGQWAIAFGSPFRLTDTMTVGVVSSLHREQTIGSGEETKNYPSLIQTDASINPGNSGGPLVDVYGRVVGINVAIESPSGGNVGIGFAIPANTAKYVMDQLIRTGSVARGFLGVALAPMEMAQQQGVTTGALVTQLNDNTPAARAGVLPGDVVTKFDGKDVATDGDLRQYVARTRPGTTVPMTVRRDDHNVTLNVTVGSPEANKMAMNNDTNSDDTPNQAAPVPQGKLGIRIANASDASVRQQLGLKGNPSGAVVVELQPGSPAQEAGLQPGDIITRLNGQSITDAAGLSAAARNLKDGQKVNAIIRRGSSTILAQINLE
jgi:serine protease Do